GFSSPSSQSPLSGANSAAVILYNLSYPSQLRDWGEILMSAALSHQVDNCSCAWIGTSYIASRRCDSVKIIVYKKSGCPWAAAVEAFLKALDVPFQSRDMIA